MFPLLLVHLFTDESVVDHEVLSFYLRCMQEQVTLVHNLTDKVWRVEPPCAARPPSGTFDSVATQCLECKKRVCLSEACPTTSCLPG